MSTKYYRVSILEPQLEVKLTYIETPNSISIAQLIYIKNIVQYYKLDREKCIIIITNSRKTSSTVTLVCNEFTITANIALTTLPFVNKMGWLQHGAIPVTL
jgi:hypothetical protein